MKFRRLFQIISIISSVLFSEDGPVYHVPIHGTIDMGLPHYIQRVVDEAKEHNAQAIIFDIDTFGGRVDAATQIKDIILDSKEMSNNKKVKYSLHVNYFVHMFVHTYI